jgi:hypothetical protein
VPGVVVRLCSGVSTGLVNGETRLTFNLSGGCLQYGEYRRFHSWMSWASTAGFGIQGFNALCI